METTFGVLCLIPPILAIVLALITKETILSLLIATWVGSTIINGWNPLVGFVKIISDYVMPSISGNASLLVLVTLSGGLIAIVLYPTITAIARKRRPTLQNEDYYDQFEASAPIDTSDLEETHGEAAPDEPLENA